LVIRLLAGDCRDVLATLPAESVQCVVTSPPYYALRDYGTAQWDGGDAACDHAAKPAKRGKAEYTNGQGGSFASNLQAWGDRDVSTVYRDTCGKCGATRVDRQIGLEATPDEYLATMVAVFREVRRVLRRDGTCWVNMGDSYNANQGSGFNGNAGKPTASPRVNSGLAPKQLLMMPARLALALQADGWWIRSDIIWHKPNPMPESVTDRPTSAHEHVFMLTKSARYFYDADAVREEGAPESASRYNYAFTGDAPNSGKLSLQAPRGFRETNGTRNLRNVWTIATAPYSEAHFATFPPALAERCIRAGTSERGCCSQCGKPWGRQTETGYIKNPNTWGKSSAGRAVVTGSNNWDGGAYPNLCKQVTTTGWAPSCACGADTVPCTVLDPFAGAGTTLLVADRLQRDAIGIELNVAYTEMAMQRCRDDAPLFVDAPAADPEDERMADLFAEAAE
jgi:DNA modification methylase